MCMQDTELDKTLRKLARQVAAVESRLYTLEESHGLVHSWLHSHTDDLDRIPKHPAFLFQIERVRGRLFDLEARLENLEMAHPESYLDRQEAARNG